MEEKWKTIENFNNYSISNFGNIKNNKNNKILKFKILGSYYIIRLSTPNKQDNILYIHELVAKYFLDNPDNKLLVYHLDENKLNNNVNNLYYYNIDDNKFNCLETEIFKQIQGYDNYYISNFGRIKNNHNNRENIMTPTINNNYYSICLIKDEKEKQFYIHRLIAIYFIDNPLNKPYVDHINRIKTDNRIINLRWVTEKENSYNITISSNNTSGFQGIIMNKTKKKWIARIIVNRKTIHLGTFNEKGDASKAYQDAKLKYHVIE